MQVIIGIFIGMGLAAAFTGLWVFTWSSFAIAYVAHYMTKAYEAREQAWKQWYMETKAPRPSADTISMMDRYGCEGANRYCDPRFPD